MKKIFIIYLFWTILAQVAFAQKNDSKLDRAREEISSYLQEKDAKFGIACIYDGKDTLQINGNKDFPMLSVYKFPQAIAVINFCSENNVSLEDSIYIPKSDIKINTYSPIREKYGLSDLHLPIKEVLYYSLAESDNNACDVLYKIMGGPLYADSIISELGFKDIHMLNTEDEMHNDIYLSYQNSCTPLGMCRLLDYFNNELVHTSGEYKYIDYLMQSCKTGNDRLAKPLLKTNAILSHKTGTGGLNSQNRIIGINDVGFVKLPNNHSYSIAVFIAESNYNPEITSSFIAEISEIIWRNLQ